MCSIAPLRASGSATRTRWHCCVATISVRVGAAARAVRDRVTNPDEVTFIVDRNLNYTNVCVTDCDFCAFYRPPGRPREGYVLPKPVIFKKIEETLELGGTGC